MSMNNSSWIQFHSLVSNHTEIPNTSKWSTRTNKQLVGSRFFRNDLQSIWWAHQCSEMTNFQESSQNSEARFWDRNERASIFIWKNRLPRKTHKWFIVFKDAFGFQKYKMIAKWNWIYDRTVRFFLDRPIFRRFIRGNSKLPSAFFADRPFGRSTEVHP